LLEESEMEITKMKAEMRFGFENRRRAGIVLADALDSYRGRNDLVVLALPRGGVPVAFEVAKKLNAPLDVSVVRKLGVPGQEELAFGAVASGGERVLNYALVHALGINQHMIERITERETAEMQRREKAYRGPNPPKDVRGKTVIVVDDGLATGATMRAAVEALRTKGPREIVVAVPVGSKHTCADFATKVDALCVCAVTPEPFYGVGEWYRDFSQTTDDEVCDLLDLARSRYERRAA
jgi:putative phosphoribosyl transferase